MKKLKKVLIFSKEDWEKIINYKIDNHIETNSEAIIELINYGLEYIAISRFCKEKKCDLSFEQAMEETFKEDDELLKSLATK
jgi:uncharacterized protein YutD